MNKICSLLILLTLAVAVVQTGCAAPIKESQAEPTKKVLMSKGPKKRVAVIDFENKTAYGRERLGSSAADILTTELVKSQQFIVIERAKLNQVMEEQGLGMSGVIDPKTATKAGQILGLNAIVTGAVSQFGIKSQGTDVGFYKTKLQVAETAVDIRIIDTGTGQILLAETGQGSATTETSEVLGMGGRAGYDETLAGKAMRSAIVKFIDNIIQTMRVGEWAGRIAQVEGSTVYINAGQQVGLAINDRLDVYRSGKEIIDPATGLSLGFTQTKIGQVLVTGFFGENGSVATPVVGTDFQTNDIVKLAQ